MKEVEVHIITKRPELDRYLSYWKNVKGEADILVLSTNSEEEERKLSNNINIKIIHQKTYPLTTIMNQAWARNELLSHAEGRYILFFDDWQIPDEHLLVEHLRYLRAGYIVCGRQVLREKDGIEKEDIRNIGCLQKCDYHYFWTCNASCSLKDILAVNGFDNHFNGGTGGEDLDLGRRIQLATGRPFLYNPAAVVNHISHVHLSKGSSCYHDLDPYRYIPECGHFGDWNLMESEQFEFWLRDGFKYYKCRRCGQIGLVDSLQVSLWNKKHHITQVSWGLKRSFGSLRNLEFEKK